MLPAESTLGCILTAPWLAPAEPLTRGWRIFAEVANLLAPGLRVSNGLSSDMMSADPKMIADSASDSLLLRAATPRWYVSALRVQQEVFKDAAKFRLPLYCVMGDNDRIADRTAAERFVSQVGSVSRQFELIPGGRHEILRDSARWTTLSRILNWMTAQAAAEESVSPRRIRTNVD